MYLLQSWQESLKVFIPKNFKLYLLATLNAALHTYKALVLKYWWVLLGYLAVDLGIGFATYNLGLTEFFLAHETLYEVLSMVQDYSYVALILLVALAARPSVQKKDAAYLAGYGKHLAYFMVVAVALNELFGPQPLATNLWIKFAFLFEVSYLSPLFVFFTLFLLDVRPSLRGVGKAMLNAGTMCLYNYPFCLASFIMLYGLSAGFFYVQGLLVNLLHLPMAVVLFDFYIFTPVRYFVAFMNLFFMVIPFCYFATLYTKRLHEQFTLYFEVKS
jgi:hypothetical protein